MEKLANELIREVTEQLSGRDIKNVRLVSKQLNNVAERLLWDTRAAVLQLNRKTLFQAMLMLKDWQNGCTASTLISRLEVVSLAPRKELKSSNKVTISGYREWETPPPDSEEVDTALKKLPKLLRKALRELKGLKSVRWVFDVKDEATIRRIVIDSLAKLPILADLEIDAKHIYDPIPLLRFHKFRQGKLNRLSVLGRFSDCEGQSLTSNLASLLRHNPGLIELKLDNTGPIQDFSLIFDGIPPGTVKLKSLYLKGWLITSPPKVVCHLQALETFEFMDQQGEKSAELWKSLQLAGTSPRRLAFGSASASLIEYLGSFSGLEELSLLQSRDSDGGVSYHRLAQQFYEKVLPKHAASLRKLVISPPFDNGWAIGVTDVNAFDGCTKLECLVLCLKPEHIRPQRAQDDVVTQLITSLYQLPSIASTSIDPVLPQWYRNMACGAARSRVKDGEAQRAREALGNVRLPIPTTPRQFGVCIGSQQYQLSAVGRNSNLMTFRAGELQSKRNWF